VPVYQYQISKYWLSTLTEGGVNSKEYSGLLLHIQVFFTEVENQKCI